MNSIQSARRLLLAVVALLLIADAAAIAVLLSPSGRGRGALEDQYQQVRQQYQAKLRETGPARDIDKRLADARKQTADFFKDRIPVRYSEISNTIGKLAFENHVQVSNIKYETRDTEIDGLQEIGITTQIKGNYNDQMRFINALERAKTFFVIDGVNLSGAENGSVQLQMKLGTFKRSAA